MVSLLRRLGYPDRYLPMDENEFWAIIESVSNGPLDVVGSEERLITIFDGSTCPDAHSFCRRFLATIRNAATTRILEAFVVAKNCWTFDEQHFYEFRCWLLLLGRDAYHSVLANPDELTVIDGDPLSDWQWDFHPKTLFEKTTGRQFNPAKFPDPWITPIENPDLRISNDDLANSLPRLSRRMERWNRGVELDQHVFLNAELVRIVDAGDCAQFIFSSLGEIHLFDYWDHCRRIYHLDSPDLCCQQHPLIGHQVVSIIAERFPTEFVLWFDNRRKLDILFSEKRDRTYWIHPQGIGR